MPLNLGRNLAGKSCLNRLPNHDTHQQYSDTGFSSATTSLQITKAQYRKRERSSLQSITIYFVGILAQIGKRKHSGGPDAVVEEPTHIP